MRPAGFLRLTRPGSASSFRKKVPSRRGGHNLPEGLEKPRETFPPVGPDQPSANNGPMIDHQPFIFDDLAAQIVTKMDDTWMDANTHETMSIILGHYKAMIKVPLFIKDEFGRGNHLPFC